jgi:hypothetical protein
MRIRLKGINSKRKQLADGSYRTYYWLGKGGPALRGEPGTPEFQASYNEAVAKKVTPPDGVLVTLLQQYQASDNFRSRRDRTRHDYIQQIKRIERDLGDFPLAALTDRRTRGVFMEWRDKLALSSRRQADYAWQVLALVLAWAKERGKITSIHANAAADFIAAVGLTRFGPTMMRPRSCGLRLHICACRCCSRCGPGSGKAICCGFRGRPMTARTSACASPKLACRSALRSGRH